MICLRAPCEASLVVTIVSFIMKGYSFSVPSLCACLCLQAFTWALYALTGKKSSLGIFGWSGLEVYLAGLGSLDPREGAECAWGSPVKFLIVLRLHCNHLTQRDWQKSSLVWLKVLILWQLHLDNSEIDNRGSCFQIKISSSALITWSIISIRVVELYLRAPFGCLQTTPPLLWRRFCWVKPVW